MRLVSACAMAEPGVYALLLPILEATVWRDQNSQTKLVAASGMSQLNSQLRPVLVNSCNA